MDMEERKKLRKKFLKDLYSAFYENNSGKGIVVEIMSTEGREKELIYQPLVDKKLVDIKGHGMGKREYKITAYGIDAIENDKDI